MTPKICVSVIGRTSEKVLRMVKSAEDEGADLVEVRLDHLREDVNLGRIRRSAGCPLIATNRLPSEGGLFEGVERERQRMLLDAAAAGFDFVDIELDTPELGERIRRLRETGRKVIVSSHVAERPELKKLDSTFKRQRLLEPDLCKIVTKAEMAVDNLTSLQFLAQVSSDAGVVCFCMGPLGRLSRVFSPLFGGAFTYAAVAKGREAASGQLTVSEMRELYRLLGEDS